MTAMKKQIFFAMALVAAMSLNAQEPVQYTQKLDSVVGSYDPPQENLHLL